MLDSVFYLFASSIMEDAIFWEYFALLLVDWKLPIQWLGSFGSASDCRVLARSEDWLRFFMYILLNVTVNYKFLK